MEPLHDIQDNLRDVVRLPGLRRVLSACSHGLEHFCRLPGLLGDHGFALTVHASHAGLQVQNVSGKELVFFEIVYWLFLKFARAPGLSGGRGEMAMAVASSARLAFLRGLLYAVHQTLSLCSLYSSSHGAPGHNRWGVAETQWRRHHSLRSHKGET